MSQSHITTETSSESTPRHQSYEELVGQLTEVCKRYHESNRKRLAAGLWAGRLLIQAKQQVQHGDFGRLLDSLDFPARTAQRYMRMAAYETTTIGIVESGGINATIDRIDSIVNSLLPEMARDKLLPCPYCLFAEEGRIEANVIRRDGETDLQVAASLGKSLNDDGTCPWHLSYEEQVERNHAEDSELWKMIWQHVGDQAGTD